MSRMSLTVSKSHGPMLKPAGKV
ncbi:hypothetical protein RSAG8_13964, partial [Rhizoctonia solani AG-8 WAC10335]